MNTKRVLGVIGAGFGDEGKGKTVSYLCEKNRGSRPLVIRYNGGAQAAHNVILDEGIHHTFSHFGSGTFYNIPTYFSNQFIVNPLLFMQEFKKLNELGGNSFCKSLTPVTYFSPNCRVSVPYDMLYNLALEYSRGKNNHGTCGVGINATIVRYRELKDNLNPLSLKISDLFLADKEEFFAYMDVIRDYYRKKLQELDGVDEYLDALEIENTNENFWNTVSQMKQHCKIYILQYLVDDHDVFICESAQGLMLSEKFGTFPYLTPSDPGATEVVKIANEVSKKYPCVLELNYLTRAYTTRHGAGPLPGEDTAENLGICTKDEINDNNGNQGVFRYAPLDVDQLVQVVETDSLSSLKGIQPQITLRPLNIVINCCDQISNSGETVKRIMDTFEGFGMTFLCGTGPRTNDMCVVFRK